MYLILFLLLGFLTGGIFYVILDKNDVKPSICIICGVTMSVVCAAVYLCIRRFGLYPSMPIILTLAVLGTESVSDIVNRQTYTIPIYLGCLLILMYKLGVHIGAGNLAYMIYVCAFAALYGICCYCLSYLLHGKLGAGDLDIYFLISLTSPSLALILLASAAVMFVKNSLTKPKSFESLPHSILYKPMPFVPFLTFMYIAFLLIGGVRC